MYGWIGTILRVNLTNRTVSKEPLEPGLAKQYIGARGLGRRSCTTRWTHGWTRSARKTN